MSPAHPAETIASIAKLARDGLSASQIAALIGLNRNKVIGIAFRNKDEIQLNGRWSGGSPKGTVVPRKKRRVIFQMPMVCDPIADEPPPAQSVTFAKLQPDHCRFPYGERDYTFCGGKRVEGRAYCAHHCRICFYPRWNP